jgi:hypothetical protein
MGGGKVLGIGCLLLNRLISPGIGAILPTLSDI